MSRLIRNTEVLQIKDRKKLQEVIEFRLSDTEVHEVYATECSFVGIPLKRDDASTVAGQMNIFDVTAIDGIRTDNDIPGCISDDAISDCMRENGIVLRLPLGDKFAGVPVCNVAMGSVGDRINLKGRGMYAVEETKVFEPYTPEEKALIANMGLQHNKGKMQVLTQDETVVTIRSAEYAYIDSKGIIEAFEEVAATHYDVKFVEGTLDRQLMITDFALNDEAKQKKLTRELQSYGFDCASVSVKVKIVTSDCGESAVRIYTILDFGNGRQIFNSETASLIHNKGASVEKFRDKTLPRALSLITQTEKTVSNLAKIQIENAGGCLRNIASKLHMPKEASILVGADMDDMYPTGCTALDVYCNLYEIAAVKQRQSGEELSPSQVLSFNEKISKALFMDFALSDIEFEWRD